MRHWIVRYGIAAVLAVGIALRILAIALPDNQLQTPWSGGSDTPAYVLLAKNLLDGRGFSYAGQPSAFRAPAYPLLLAGLMGLFGSEYVAAVRWLQFAMGLATAYLCSRVAARLFGQEAAKAALAFALFFPTLVLMSSEVLSECAAAFLVSVFLFLLTEYLTHPRWPTAAEMGLTTGLASLFRFNFAALLLVGLWAGLRSRRSPERWKQAAGMALAAALVVAPWMVRNEIVFGGRVLFSTHGGLNAALAFVTPQGRTQPGETDKIREALGWALPQDLETNGPGRAGLPGEAELNRQGWSVAGRLWRQSGWHGVPLVLTKLAAFWLSTDQLFNTTSFPPRQRVARAVGVLIYWLLLLFAARGWYWLRGRDADTAHVFLAYAAILTLLHLPFVMNTRLRMPLMDPLLMVLASGGWLALASRAPKEVRNTLPAIEQVLGR